jgi:type I restriction enzyme S subunit
MTLRVHPDEIVRDSDSPLLAIHPSWERVRLADVADVLNGFAFKSTYFSNSEGMPLLRIRDVGRSKTEANYVGEFDPLYLVEPGGIVVGMDGDFRVARWAGPVALLNQRVCRVSVRDETGYDADLLFYTLPGYLDAIHARTSSVTVKHLSSRTVQDIPLPLPPLAEQRRIVAAIEKHFSRLDSAGELLRRARLRLARLGDTAMHRAFSGDWPWVATGDLAEVQGGIQKQPKRRPVRNTAPFLRVANVLRGKLDLAEVHEVELFEGELDRYRLVPGDLLVVEGNGSIEQIGRCAMWRNEIADCVHQNHLIRVRPGPDLSPAFLNAYWNSPATRRRLAEVASSTSGLYTLSTSKVKAVPVPIVPLVEQERIVAMVDQQLSIVDSMNAEIDHALRRSKALRRSILEQAFSGTLVAQDPSDEPASVLLERIAAERAAAPKPPRRKRKIPA